ncbi:MAG: GNAT family N-acetyltransferase [Planctomycetota bacterium]
MTEQTTRPTATDPVAVVPPGASFSLRPTAAEDYTWMRRVLKQYWASEQVVTGGRLHDVLELEGIAAWRDDEPVGLITYRVEGDECEIVTHNSMADSGGIGSCLLSAVRQEARARGCERLWLVTTNDNVPALRFYQRRDFDIAAFHRGAITEARKLKPEMPDTGLDGIPIRHEIELEYLL